jgi:hypothetical protein
VDPSLAVVHFLQCFPSLQSQVFSRERIPDTLAQIINMLNNTMSLILIELFFVTLTIFLLYWSFAVGLLLVAPLDEVAAQHPQIWREIRQMMFGGWYLMLKFWLGMYVFMLVEMFLKVCGVVLPPLVVERA